MDWFCDDAYMRSTFHCVLMAIWAVFSAGMLFLMFRRRKGDVGMQTTAKTYEIDGHRVDVVACGDYETPGNEIEFYDFWLRDPEGKSDTHLNEGDPWYPETEDFAPPSVEEVAEYLRHQEPELFPGTGAAVEFEAERTYRVVVLCTVTDDKKDENDRGDMDDEEYVSAELGWVDSSFAGMEIVSSKRASDPPPDCKGKSPLEVMSYLGKWPPYRLMNIMRDFIQEVDPEGFAAHVAAIAAKERSR